MLWTCGTPWTNRSSTNTICLHLYEPSRSPCVVITDYESEPPRRCKGTTDERVKRGNYLSAGTWMIAAVQYRRGLTEDGRSVD